MLSSSAPAEPSYPGAGPGNSLKASRILPVAGALVLVFAPVSAAPGMQVEALPASVAQARVAMLYDLSSGRTLYARNEQARFLPASMTKAMTLLIAFDAIKAGKLDQNSLMTAAPETARKWSGQGTTLYLQSGEKVPVHALIAGIATVSANDASVVLAEGMAGSVSAFTAAMNRRAASLGMTGSHFATPNGFPDGGATYVSAADLVKLARALVEEHPILYRRYIGAPSMEWKGQTFPSHSPFAGVVPGADGIKTGHTYEAGFNFLGSAERNGRRLVTVIGGVWTAPGRAQASRDLIEWGFSQWTAREWLKPGTPVARLKVQQGNKREITATVPSTYRMTAAAGAPGKATATITYFGPLVAPVAKGAKVGELRVSVDGALPYTLPLVAAESVGRASAFDRMVNGLLGVWQ